MTTEVIITGTGYPLPDPHRAGPGVLVRYGDITLQFDTGRATAQRLAAAGVWLPDLTAVFVTHHHSDHLTGFPDVVLSHWVIGRGDHVKALPVVVPAGPAEDYVQRDAAPVASRPGRARRAREAHQDGRGGRDRLRGGQLAHGGVAARRRGGQRRSGPPRAGVPRRRLPGVHPRRRGGDQRRHAGLRRGGRAGRRRGRAGPRGHALPRHRAGAGHASLHPRLPRRHPPAGCPSRSISACPPWC